MKKIIIITLLYVPIYLLGQTTLYNNGAIITTGTNAIVTVNGDTKNATGSEFYNIGEVRLNGDYTNNDVATTKGGGDYLLQGDWINEGTFIHDTSHVRLLGGFQTIGGDTVTRFNRLTLENTGVKSLLISSEINSVLNLNNLELATLDDTMYVLSTNPQAIEYDNTFGSEGFVSGNFTGSLYRNCDIGSVYDFPTGSSQPGNIFRNVLITPTGAEGYFVNLRNVSPSTDGLTNLDDVCSVNTNWYHQIGSDNGTSADITVNYLAADGNFVSSANYDTDWTTISNTTPGTGPTYLEMTTTGYNDFLNIPFALATVTPTSTIHGDSTICNADIGNYYGIGESQNYTYTWLTNNGTINGNGNDTISIDFNTGTSNFVTLTVTDPISGCSSTDNDTLFLTTYNAPDTSIMIDNTTPNVGDIINITNGGVNVGEWSWEYENYSSNNQNTQHYYTNEGIYYITLEVVSLDGCIDTNGVWVTVNNKIIIPNIFTPNGDGENDLFTLSGFSKYDIYIYNRWGQELYHGNESTRSWDGKTVAGKDAPEGTYLYIIELPDTEGITGNLLLNR